MTTVEEIDTTVQELRLEVHHRGFTHKLAQIVAGLAGIPDDPPPGFSADTMIRLRQLTDETVDAVERRLASGGDDEQAQQRLVGTIYEIRRRMEAVELWFKHRESS